MNIQIKGFRVATNQNDVLHRLFQSGEYSLEKVSPSLAPSMDIQVASNFERLLYFFLDGNSEKLRDVMNEFSKKGKYCFEKFSIEGFSSYSIKDDEIPEIIKTVKDKYNYTVDPHTACAFKNLDPTAKFLILATAHPAKFPDVYTRSGLEKPSSPVLDSLLDKKIIKYPVGTSATEIRDFIERNY